MSFEFAQEKEEVQKSQLARWKILIADDEEDVHTMTKLALKKFSFEDRGLEFFDAYSGKETIEILKNDPEIDLILLDVVMDSDDDGLVTVKRIREELNNGTVRIVLRTGQPGSAPEKEVIINYGIDDYKEKTELTSIKLLTTVVASLRTSHHIKTIE
ncbi:MAG: response regulator, partial [Sulfurimonas sp.]|nr:response regulator [Sulfurimonas sp.]